MHFSITTYRIAILIGCLMLAGGSLLTVEHLQAGKAEVRELDACELYIQNYSQAAIHQQRKHRIPASITLAQGILESSAGKSYLAIEGKNHFGIKCGNWTGEFVYKQDDGRLERFRKYATVEQSFEDHSRFIAERSPYKSLFDLKPTDYVGWAHGLKRCGYATDPKYAHKLIELIERYGLHNYDLAQGTDEPPAVQRRSRTRTAPPEAPKKRIAEPKPERKRTLDTSRDMASVQREPGRKPTAHGVKVPKKAKPEQAPPKTEPAPKPAPAPAQKPAPTPAPQKEAAPAAKPAPAKQPAAQKQVAAAKPAPAAKKQAWEAKKPAPQKAAAPAAKPAPAKQPAAQKQVAAAKPAPAAKKQAWAAKKPAPQKAAPAAKPALAKQPAAQKQVAAKKPAPSAKKQAWAAKKPAPTAAPKKQDKKLLASTKKSGTAVAPKAAPNATRPAAANPAVKKNAWKKPVTPKKSAVAPQKTVATAKKPATTPKKPVAAAKKPAVTPKQPVAAAKKPAAAPKKPAATPKKSAWAAKKPAPTPKATAPKRAPRPAQRSALSRKQNNNERPTVHTARRQRLERRRA